MTEKEKPVYKITKVDGDKPSAPSVPEKKAPEVKPVITAGKRSKSMRTFPRGVLKKTMKVKPTSDPAKPPPFKKSSRKHTIRLFTDHGEKRRRKTIKKKIAKMSDAKVDELVNKHKLLKNSETPPRIKREMLSGAMLAGFISSE